MKIDQSETAIAAYHFHVLPYANQPQQTLILEKMRLYHRSGTFTIGELAEITSLDKSTVSARRNAMLKAGLLVRGEKRVCKFSGIRCETVKLNDERTV